MVGQAVDVVGGCDQELAVGARHRAAACCVQVRADVVPPRPAVFTLAAAQNGLGHHPVSHGDVAYLVADQDDVAGKLVAHDVAFQLMLVLAPVPQVGAADAGHAHADHHPILARQFGPLDLTNVERALGGLQRPSSIGLPAQQQRIVGWDEGLVAPVDQREVEGFAVGGPHAWL